MGNTAGLPIEALRVDGGACANDLLMQLQADICAIPALRPQIAETTALGAAYLAGLATGMWTDRNDLAPNWRLDRRFEPVMAPSKRQVLRAQWAEGVQRARSLNLPGDDAAENNG